MSTRFGLLWPVLGLLGCDGQVSAPVPTAAKEAILPGAVIPHVWPVRMADDAVRAPFENHPGWAALFMQRDPVGALKAFSSPPIPDGQVRAHVDLAAAYRQAARVAAVAMIEEYRELRRDEDPAATLCLVGISEALLGQEPARGHLQGCWSSDASLAASAKAWLGWLDAGTPWPPVEPLARTPGVPSGLAPGEAPDAGTLPAWVLKDEVEGRDVPLAHPGTLLGLSLAHEKAAMDAAPGLADALRVVLDPWRLPTEPRAPAGPTPVLGDALLFGSALLTSADAAYLSVLTGPEGEGALANPGDSPLAIAISPCVKAAEHAVDPACVLARAEDTYEQVLQAMRIKNGQELGFHKPFAAMARLGVIRCGEAAAAAVGDDKSMGLLRLSGLDFSVGPSAEPAYLLSITAWDAGNQNTLRATELLHAQVGRLPGVEVARYPLDALQVRVGRESAPGLPMN